MVEIRFRHLLSGPHKNGLGYRLRLASALAVTAAVVVATALALSGSAKAETSSLLIAVKLLQNRVERPVFSIRGATFEGKPLEEFGISADLNRVPCPGSYHLQVAGENLSTGISSTYVASIKLDDLAAHPREGRCGRRLPPNAGSGEVVVVGPDTEPIALAFRRSGAGAFVGALTLHEVPKCRISYRVHARLRLGRWRRSYDYRLRILSAEATLQGKPRKVDGC